MLYVLADVDDDWFYVESGDVRGFVKKSDVHYDDKTANQLTARLTAKAREQEKKTGEPCAVDDIAVLATELVPAEHNVAYTWSRATAKETVVEKQYALVKDANVKVFDDMKNSAETVGILDKDDLCYIIEVPNKGWTYIESGDVRGFVKTKSLDSSEETAVEVEEKGEEQYSLAKATVKPSDNKALYYSKKSIRMGTPDGEIKDSVVSLAVQYEGCPYEKSGKDLLNGTDSIGFVQSIYGAYGYDLPNSVKRIATAGTSVSIKSIEAGDIVIMKNDKKLNQVGIYLGDGQIISCNKKQKGVYITDMDESKIDRVVRVFENKKYVYVNGTAVEIGSCQDLIWPLDGNRNVSCGFGVRVCPFHGKEMHNGVDVAAGSGTQVHAAADGVVVKAGKHSSLGNFVVICHANGYCTWYLHNETLLVEEGQKVKQGDTISLVGMTGTATGPHLDFRTMLYDGTYVDPLTVVE